MAYDMKTGKLGIDLIKSFEKLRLKAYVDDKYGKKLTVGYGHTTGVTADTVITAELAEKYLKIDLAYAENVVNTYVKIQLNQNQFDSLVSFVFNLGGGCFRKSTMLKFVNAQRFLDAMVEMAKFHHDNHVDMPGLVKRRKAEAELFMKPINL
jgi:lysozyme